MCIYIHIFEKLHVYLDSPFPKKNSSYVLVVKHNLRNTVVESCFLYWIKNKTIYALLFTDSYKYTKYCHPHKLFINIYYKTQYTCTTNGCVCVYIHIEADLNTFFCMCFVVFIFTNIFIKLRNLTRAYNGKCQCTMYVYHNELAAAANLV